MNLYSVANFPFHINATLAFTISNVIKIQDSNVGDWCGEEDDKLYSFYMDGFRILIERRKEKQTAGSYFIYVDKYEDIELKTLYGAGK